jgi:hypothetical protein
VEQLGQVLQYMNTTNTIIQILPRVASQTHQLTLNKVTVITMAAMPL